MSISNDEMLLRNLMPKDIELMTRNQFLHEEISQLREYVRRLQTSNYCWCRDKDFTKEEYAEGDADTHSALCLAYASIRGNETGANMHRTRYGNCKGCGKEIRFNAPDNYRYGEVWCEQCTGIKTPKAIQEDHSLRKQEIIDWVKDKEQYGATNVTMMIRWLLNQLKKYE